jgi:hypothetical protein
VRTRSVALVMLIILATIGAGLVAVVALRAGEALPGTSVAGIDVGGLSREQVQQRLAGTVQARTTGPLELVHEDLRVPLDRAALGVRVDLDRTADRALDAGRTGSPWAPLLGPLLGRGEPVELAVDVDGAVLGQQVDDLAAQVDSPAFGGDLLIEGTTVTPQPPAPGRTLDREQARLAVRDALASGRTEPLPLPVEVQDPGTTADDVELVAQQAREALAAPYRLVGPQAALEVTPRELAPLLEVAYADRSLSLRVQDEAFRALVGPRADALDRPPTPAGFDVVSGQPTVDTQGDLTWSPQPAQVDVRPSTPGLDVDAEQSVQRLRELVGTPEREGELPAGEAPATLTTEQGAAGRGRLAAGHLHHLLQRRAEPRLQHPPDRLGARRHLRRPRRPALAQRRRRPAHPRQGLPRRRRDHPRRARGRRRRRRLAVRDDAVQRGVLRRPADRGAPAAQLLHQPLPGRPRVDGQLRLDRRQGPQRHRQRLPGEDLEHRPLGHRGDLRQQRRPDGHLDHRPAGRSQRRRVHDQRHAHDHRRRRQGRHAGVPDRLQPAAGRLSRRPLARAVRRGHRSVTSTGDAAALAFVTHR